MNSFNYGGYYTVITSNRYTISLNGDVLYTGNTNGRTAEQIFFDVVDIK